MNEHLLEIRNLSKVMPAATSQAPVPVLRGISLDVARGEFVAIVGPSGSGKSTLLYCMSGLEPPTEGTVRLLGNDLSALARRRHGCDATMWASFSSPTISSPR
ncbi:ABC-type lipoprotein export system ATPase subunit [Streptomyces canus]|uniref:ABC-type lipoprotein export system ATPase subunit n=1 Tax=Streptomyces canus TaxID=58343 RepID=A0AAW8F4Y3_9ACTN|nr:ATP-binding cassette domain-containing protein [Streptomyces canus]MDQ0904874.1 ABC-type lipoprotein export system ATPase subunit [Streptomyces canus]